MGMGRLAPTVLAGLSSIVAWQLIHRNIGNYYGNLSFSLIHGPAGIVNLLIGRMIASTATAVAPILAEKRRTSDDSNKKLVAIVTGSNTGIGFETAKRLAVEHDMHVVLACRSPDKAATAVAQIRALGGDASQATLNLADSGSIRKFAKEMEERHSRIHVLVNNAGRNTNPIVEGQRRDTLFATNFLGHYELTALLMPLLSSSSSTTARTEGNDERTSVSKSRIVNLSSVMHHACGDVQSRLDQPAFWTDVLTAGSKPHDTYSLSKLAAVFFTIELRKRYPDVISIAVNPGAVNSDIWRDFPSFLTPIFRLLFLNNYEGSSTSVAAAVHAAYSEASPPPPPLYLQPYHVGSNPSAAAELPMLPWRETMGPYVGHAVAAPRLPPDHGKAASAALWNACAEETEVEWL